MLTPHTIKYFSNKRVLIIGARGFIGAHLAETLFQVNAHISVLDRGNSDFNFPYDQYIGDIQDEEFVMDSICTSNPEIIYHLAADKDRSSSIEAFSKAIKANLKGSLNIFGAAKNLKKLISFVVIGSAEEYGRNQCPYVEGTRETPISSYSYSKLCVTQLCELLFNLYNIPFIIIRPTVVYGPRQGKEMFLPSLINSLLRNISFPITPGNQKRDFIFITDLISGLISAAANTSLHGQILNLGSGQSMAIRDVAAQVEQTLYKNGLVKFGVLPYRPGESMEYSVDISKALKLLEWKPLVRFEDGLNETIKYCQSLQ